MVVRDSTLRQVWRREKRNPGFMQERTLRSPLTGDGDFTAGPHEALSIPAEEEGVVGEIQVGEDSPIADAEAVLLGHRIIGSGDATIAAQTRRARPKVDLETAADGEATAGARVGFGVAKSKSNTKANAMPFTDEGDLDSNASALSDDQIDPLTPQKTGFRWATSGEYITFIAQAPPAGAESYGMDHTEIRLPVLVWDGSGL